MEIQNNFDNDLEQLDKYIKYLKIQKEEIEEDISRKRIVLEELKKSKEENAD